MVTAAELLLSGFATLVAVTVAKVVVVTEGAWKRPELETLPLLADQVTAVLLVPVTYAVNCCEPPELMLALVGESVTDTPLLSTLSAIQWSPWAAPPLPVTSTWKL